MKDSEINNLAEKAKNDSEAFGVLYDYLYTRLFNYTYRRVINKQLTEDILSNAFFKALKKLDQYDENKGAFRNWIYRIVINEIQDSYRKKSKYIFIPPEDLEYIFEYQNEDPTERLEDELDGYSQFQIVNKAILQLKPIYQDLLHLKYFEEFSNKEIAETVDIPEGRVRVYLHRAQVELKKILESDAVNFLEEINE